MTIDVADLRADLDRLLEDILATGEPLLIRLGEKTLSIGLVEEAGARPAPRALRRDLVAGDPADVARMDWSGGWAGGKEL